MRIAKFTLSTSSPWPLIAAVLLGTLIASGPASAQVPRVEQDPAQRLLQDQRDRNRQRELEQPAPRISAPSTQAAQATAPGAATDIESVAETGPVFKIDQIKLIGNSVLSQADVDNIEQAFLGKHLGSARINLLLRRFTEAFVAHGLITTRAYLGEQNLRSGTLAITFVPGVIESIRLNGQALSPRDPKAPGRGLLHNLGIKMALPTAPGELLNLTDLEQGVEQINRLRLNKAEMQILPGTTPGGSIVGLSNKTSDPFWFSAGIDNYGSEQTGLNRLRIGIEADNLLGLQEALSINYSGSRETNALVGSVAVPFGYDTFSYTTSFSEYQSLIADTALLYGESVSSTWGWNRVLARSQAAKTALDVSLSLRRSDRDINDITLDPQKLSVLRVGLNTLRRFLVRQQPAAWTLDAGISQGLDAFGADQDMALQQSDAHSQFTKFDLTGTLNLPLATVHGADFNWKSQLNGQWSAKGLFDSEQLFVGGMSSVRGYRESATSGDRGAFMRNEILCGNVPAIIGMRIEPYVFFDMGMTELIAERRTRRLAGTGIGVRLQTDFKKQNLSGEITLGRAVQADDLDPQSTTLLATLNWSY
jgi:hemolysin activation/secretion protein